MIYFMFGKFWRSAPARERTGPVKITISGRGRKQICNFSFFRHSTEKFQQFPLFFGYFRVEHLAV